MSASLVAVIDTNVALDLLVFADRRCRPLRAALEDGRASWIASPAMRAELAAVLERGFGGRWPFDARRVLETWDAFTRVMPEPLASGLQCRDGDDQVFLDLALARAPCWLLTRDRALLRLAGPARRKAVTVQPPDAWPDPTSNEN